MSTNRVSELWAYVRVKQNGDETVLAIHFDPSYEYMDIMHKATYEHARLSNDKLRVLRFREPEIIRTVQPTNAAPSKLKAERFIHNKAAQVLFTIIFASAMLYVIYRYGG